MSVITRFTRLLVVAAALSVVAIPATASAAKKLVKINRCAPAFADKSVNVQGEEASALSVTCLINQARAASHLAPLQQQFTYAPNGALDYGGAPLYRSARAHAVATVAAQSWDRNRGEVSHLDPGTPVPDKDEDLQKLAGQQIDARIRGAGYCAGGSYNDAEITYSGNGSLATPRAAVNWWLSDPPHAAILLSSTLKEFRIAIVSGNPFPDNAPDAAAFVMDLGSCS